MYENPRIFCRTVAMAAALAMSCAADCATASGALYDSAHACDVRLKGWLGERLDAMVRRHVAACDVDCITAPFMDKRAGTDPWSGL